MGTRPVPSHKGCLLSFRLPAVDSVKNRANRREEKSDERHRLLVVTVRGLALHEHVCYCVPPSVRPKTGCFFRSNGDRGSKRVEL
jgi:hypothetical protein